MVTAGTLSMDERPQRADWASLVQENMKARLEIHTATGDFRNKLRGTFKI